LFHAILYRKGNKTFRKKIIGTGEYEPLQDRIARMQQIDTNAEIEGIVWH